MPPAVSDSHSVPVPYWRLSSFYLFYFATLGALLPYWSLYLKHEGFSALAIGQLMAVLMATKIIAPNIWGWLADRSGRRVGIVRGGSLLALLAFGAVFWAQGYWTLALVMFAFSFFWNAVLPQFEAATLTHLGNQNHRYSAIRVWGSIGFIVTVAGIGPLLDLYGPSILPGIILVLFAAIWLASLAVPETRPAPIAHEPSLSLGAVLRQPAVLALLAISFLMQLSHGPYYTFYSIFMEDLGYSRSVIGQFWALGVVAEVGVFMVMPRLIERYGLRNLLLLSLALTTLRWLLTGWAATLLPVMLFAQTLHAASFGIFHAVVIVLFFRYFSGRNHGQGQALYSSVSYGLGGALGAYYSGLTWESLGPGHTFAIAAAAAALGALITWRWIERQHA